MLRGLVASNDRESRYLEFYIDALLKHNEMSSAETYLDLLEKLAPNWFGTVSRKADLLCATNQPPQAFEALRNFVDNVDAEPRDRGLRLRMVAEKLVRARRAIDEAGTSVLRCARPSISPNRCSEPSSRRIPARNWCWRYSWENTTRWTKPSASSTKACKSATSSEFSQACSLIVEERQGHHGSIAAHGQDHEGGGSEIRATASPAARPWRTCALARTLYSEAVDIYREVLRKTPDDAFAMNNLAVLQALQGDQT